MKLDGVQESDNVDDRRGSGGGGGGKIVLGGAGIVVVVVVSLLTGRSPGEIINALNQGQGQGQGRGQGQGQGHRSASEDRAKVFVSRVLTTTEQAWEEQFTRMGKRYEKPRLELFTDSIDSACGYATSAVGPFYCSADSEAYLDLTFFAELSDRFGAPGDFAQAYVVAHEIGHHVQNLLGTTGQVARSGGKDTGPKGSSVRMELQADCYAGVWGAYAKRRGFLDTGDVEEAIQAAQSIGDDTLQRRARGKVAPESFTHGTSAQRVKWFRRGMARGERADCDTFRTPDL